MHLVVQPAQPGTQLLAYLRVQRDFENFAYNGAYAASLVLAAVAILTMLVSTVLRPKEDAR